MFRIQLCLSESLSLSLCPFRRESRPAKSVARRARVTCSEFRQQESESRAQSVAVSLARARGVAVGGMEASERRWAAAAPWCGGVWLYCWSYWRRVSAYNHTHSHTRSSRSWLNDWHSRWGEKQQQRVTLYRWLNYNEWPVILMSFNLMAILRAETTIKASFELVQF